MHIPCNKDKKKTKKEAKVPTLKEKKFSILLMESFLPFQQQCCRTGKDEKSNIIHYKALSSVFFFTVAFICIVLSRATLRWRCILFRTTHNTTHSYNRLFINDRLSIVNIICGINLGCTSFIHPSNK